MIQQTPYNVNLNLLNECKKFSNIEHRLVLNEPSGNFFYDKWKLLDEFKETVIETVLSVLPNNIGEARIITLKSGTCYYSHSDIDDRYHLNISGDSAALIDLENNINYFLNPDGIWYEMDAGCVHSAASFGEYDRIQIVVRKLLIDNKLLNPVKVLIEGRGENPRYKFDKALSPWLNRANKNGIITNFEKGRGFVCFDVEEESITELNLLVPKEFKVDYV